jgi:hypothetical protein
MAGSLRQTRLRLWQAGDMPGEGNNITSIQELDRLIDAVDGLECWTYTHKPVLPSKGVPKRLAEQNAKKIKHLNDYGVSVNLSGNSPAHADSLADLNVGPVVTVLPSNATKDMKTPAGRKIVICPATLSDHVSCETCGGERGALCARNARSYIIGFPAHGVRKKAASEVSKDGIEG